VARRLLRLRRLRLLTTGQNKRQRPATTIVAAQQEDDLANLRRENARLREENELLKKAAIYFARGSM
jgi:transposase-like protein